MACSAMTHQATCIAIQGRGLLIEGPPGSGKSSLALALIDRGAVLIGDDGVLLQHTAGGLVARPHPETRGLLEVRNLGLLTYAVADAARIALIVSLDPHAPRLPPGSETCERGGVAVPLIRLTPHDATLPIKAELALRRAVAGS